MKFYLKVDEEAEPSVTVTCKKVTCLVRKIGEICALFDEQEDVIYGYDGEDVILLKLADVSYFYTKNGKVYARASGEEYLLKLRIKQIMEIIDDSFVKINQGCVIKVNEIKKFAVSFGGALKVVLKDGYCDYVARRETSNIKRRFGL